jgi:hypothetical protein
MKKSLQFPTGIVLLLLSVLSSKGQTIILAENFPGFTTGSHTTPSTSDASATLDLKTSVPGWTGNLIYSAGGEIKIGTSSTSGWIESPLVDISSGNVTHTVGFDIARWPGDATTVQVYLDGSPVGEVITPSDDFRKKEIILASGTSSSKIRIQGVTKRFFLDNFYIKSENIPTAITGKESVGYQAKVFPVPASNKLIISNLEFVYLIEIHDITGKLVKEIRNDGSVEIEIDLAYFNKGIYIVVLSTGTGKQLLKFLKI